MPIEKSNFYQTLFEIPIENYINFRVWYNMYSILGSNETDLKAKEALLKVFEKIDNKQKVAIQKANIAGLKYCIENDINYARIAAVCLMKDTNIFNFKSLQDKLLIYKDELTIIQSIGVEIAENIHQEILQKSFEEVSSIITNGKYRTKKEEKQFNRRRSMLVDAYKHNDESKYFRFLSDINPVVSAAKQERELMSQLYETLAILQQRAIINTALDFYMHQALYIKQIEMQNSQSKSKSKAPDEMRSGMLR